MKKVILSVLVVAIALLSACSGDNKVETSEAKEVVTEKKATTQTFTKIGEGSHLTWRAAHLGGIDPRFGKVMPKSAEILVTDGTVTNAAVVLDMATFTVENFEDEETMNKLKGHLLSDDFFKSATYPTSKFELTGIAKGEGEYNSKVTGNLTILDVTKSISFNANITAGDNVSIQSEKFAIDRRDWGLTYNVEGTEGVPVDYIIANDVEFMIDVTVGK